MPNTIGKHQTRGATSGPGMDPIEAEIMQAGAAERETRERFDPDISRVPRMALADFKRDLNMENVLIHGRWAVRGCISMHVSTTGSGKSILQTQSALCFNRGVECCGLRPVRPFRSWVIQSEDDEDRVAMDRDDVVAELTRMHPGEDWGAAMAETKFLDFDGVTGAAFIEKLNNELYIDKPDAIIINPFNAYFGGNIKDGADVSAFFKGGMIRNKETEGLEKVFKRHKVWGWIFAHTGKPPTTKEQRDWFDDPYSAYKMCGASEIADAVRSVITFLKCPNTDGIFAFTAGKNGAGLKWTDENGAPCTRVFFQWGEGGKHYWRDVEKAKWDKILSDAKHGMNARKAQQQSTPIPADETPIALEVFGKYKKPVPKESATRAVWDAINAHRGALYPPAPKMTRVEARAFIEDLDARGVIEIWGKGKSGARGALCGLPDLMRKHAQPNLIEDETEEETPGDVEDVRQ